LKLFENTKIPMLAKALDAYSLRHKIISSNLANITTVGYKSQSVSFEEQLSGALNAPRESAAATDGEHLLTPASPVEALEPKIIGSTAADQTLADGNASGVNDVDIDFEMTELAKNQLRFKFASKLLGESFRALQKSIRGQS
jgi:flagellar basal-body rod protein FlgB